MLVQFCIKEMKDEIFKIVDHYSHKTQITHYENRQKKFP